MHPRIPAFCLFQDPSAGPRPGLLARKDTPSRGPNIHYCPATPPPRDTSYRDWKPKPSMDRPDTRRGPHPRNSKNVSFPYRKIARQHSRQPPLPYPEYEEVRRQPALAAEKTINCRQTPCALRQDNPLLPVWGEADRRPCPAYGSVAAFRKPPKAPQPAPSRRGDCCYLLLYHRPRRMPFNYRIPRRSSRFITLPLASGRPS